MKTECKMRKKKWKISFRFHELGTTRLWGISTSITEDYLITLSIFHIFYKKYSYRVLHIQQFSHYINEIAGELIVMPVWIYNISIYLRDCVEKKLKLFTLFVRHAFAHWALIFIVPLLLFICAFYTSILFFSFNFSNMFLLSVFL